MKTSLLLACLASTLTLAACASSAESVSDSAAALDSSVVLTCAGATVTRAANGSPTLRIDDADAEAALRSAGYGELLGNPGPRGEIVIDEAVEGPPASGGAFQSLTEHRCFEGLCTKYYLAATRTGSALSVSIVGYVAPHQECIGEWSGDSCIGRLEAVPESYPLAGGWTFHGCGAPAAGTTLSRFRSFEIMFEGGNHWGGYGAGLVSESAVTSTGETRYLTGGAGEYGDQPEVIQSKVEAGGVVRFVYAQDGIYDGWYSESESGPGPRPNKLVSFTKIELQYTIDGGAVRTQALTGDLASTEVTMPTDAAGKPFAYWFKISGSDGKTYWESRNAGNYHVAIVPVGSITLP